MKKRRLPSLILLQHGLIQIMYFFIFLFLYYFMDTKRIYYFISTFFNKYESDTNHQLKNILRDINSFKITIKYKYDYYKIWLFTLNFNYPKVVLTIFLLYFFVMYKLSLDTFQIYTYKISHTIFIEIIQM